MNFDQVDEVSWVGWWSPVIRATWTRGQSPLLDQNRDNGNKIWKLVYLWGRTSPSQRRSKSKGQPPKDRSIPQRRGYIQPYGISENLGSIPFENCHGPGLKQNTQQSLKQQSTQQVINKCNNCTQQVYQPKPWPCVDRNAKIEQLNQDPQQIASSRCRK